MNLRSTQLRQFPADRFVVGNRNIKPTRRARDYFIVGFGNLACVMRRKTGHFVSPASLRHQLSKKVKKLW